jgi:cell division septation protein DedD
VPPDTSEARADIWFAVQIGAFKDPQHATMAQGLARDRYHLPVINEFSLPAGLYQIRLGAFPSHDAAHEFLTMMQQDYPVEYRDSWVVQLKR